MKRLAINGFGRIGRAAFKIALDKKNLQVSAINDLTDTKTLAHLLKYDTVYGIYDKKVSYDQNNIIVNNKKYPVYAISEPKKLPWKKLKIDVVLECTGHFTALEDAQKHLRAGAKKVLISANSKTESVRHIVLGVNQESYNPNKDNIIAIGSCTTNCLAPVAYVINNNFKIEKGFVTTIHSYTTSQKLLDLPHKNLREARAAALNIIPTETGAAKAVARVIPELKEKIDGIAFRVPTPTVSVIDFVCQVSKKVDTQKVVSVFKREAKSKKLKGILAVESNPLVSADYKKNPHSAIIDLPLIMVKDNLIKIIAWYDNEWGYSTRLVEMAEIV